MNLKPCIVDAHCHLDTLKPDLLRKDLYYISWSYAGNGKSMADISENLKNHAKLIKDLNKNGYSCGWLAGVHPRSITDDFEISAVPEMILPFLDDEYCLGIGEIGIETDSIIERNLFLSHLSLCDELRKKGKVIGVHIPGKSKYEMARLTESLLSGFQAYRDIIIVDHLDEATLGVFLDKGFHAGVTLNENKLKASELREIINNISPEKAKRIIAGSDSYHKLSNEFFISADMEQGSGIFFENAVKFFKL